MPPADGFAFYADADDLWIRHYRSIIWRQVFLTRETLAGEREGSTVIMAGKAMMMSGGNNNKKNRKNTETLFEAKEKMFSRRHCLVV